MIQEIQTITNPFATSWEHVQGPGGNTSVKDADTMLIKASGFTFHDVAQATGLVWIDHQQALKNLAVYGMDGSLENPPVAVLKSVPDGLKPSMEFGFHAALKKYVLHTHSVYVNVVTCCTNCADLLKAIFPDTTYVLVPYVVPGHPLASYIYQKHAKDDGAAIYFLKNHGVVIHADTADEVLNLYHLVQQRIMTYLNLTTPSALLSDTDIKQETKHIAFDSINQGLNRMEVADIQDRILVPDQSIFFRDKVSDSDRSAAVYLDKEARKLTINGSNKFISAAEGMLKMVYYIVSNHQRLQLNSEFISDKEQAILHGLSSEKYRVSIL